MVSVFEPEDLIQANAVQSMLEAEGITVYLSREPKAPTSIMVSDEQRDRAAKLIRDYLSSFSPAPEESSTEKEKKEFQKLYAWIMILLVLIMSLLTLARSCR